jgi:hypothetical protein
MTSMPSSLEADQVREVMIEAARTQLAAVTAGIKFWAGWVEAADRYAEAVGVELAKLDGQDKEDTGDVVGRLTDLTRGYFRDMTELPSVAVKHFNGQLETIGKPKPKPKAKGPRSRAARAKD